MPKKGENIYKRKDNRWEARYIKGYSDDGLAQFGYCYGKTYRQAKEKLLLSKMNLTLGIISEKSKKQSFSDCCDEWLLLNRTRVKISTYSKYTSIVEGHIKTHLGKYPISSLSTPIMENFANDLITLQGLSQESVRGILTILKSILKYVKREYKEFTQNIDLIYPQCSKKETRVLSPDEENVLLEYLFDDMTPLKFSVIFALSTGIRIGELCALKWKNISLESATVKIDATMQRVKNFNTDANARTKISITDPKSATSKRIIPLSEPLIRLCEKFKSEDDEAYVTSGTRDEFFEPRRVQYFFEAAMKRLNIVGAHFHTLRHTFATRCVEVGFEIKSLSEVLGHSSTQITLERYVHSSLELKRENMKKIKFFDFP